MGITYNNGRNAAAITSNSSLNVGINCTPNAQFEVLGTSGAQLTDGIRVSRNTLQSSQYGVINYAGGILNLTGVNTSGGGEIRFNTSDGTTTTERMKVTSAGNVGIGTSSPLPPASRGGLVVRGNSNGGEIMLQNTDSTDGSAYGMTLVMVNNGGGTNSGDGGLLNRNNGFLNFATNNAERMRITSAGNVCIGTTTAGDKLTVVNSASYAALQIGNGTNSSFFGYANGSGNYNNGASAGDAIIRGYSGVSISGNNGASTNIYVNSSGNVGIGTSSPGSLLTLYATTYPVIAFQNSGAVRGYIGADSGNNIYNALTGNGHVFQVDGSEKMRITSNGAVLIGTTNNIAGQPSINIGGSGSSYFTVYNNYSGSSVGLEMTNSANTLKVQFFGSSGNYYFAGSNLSDRRLKSNIQEINEGLSKLMQLKPSTFTYDKNPDILKGGFIAQEVLEVMPEFVTIPEDKTEMMGVDYFGILALAVKSIQEQQKQIEELKSLINK